VLRIIRQLSVETESHLLCSLGLGDNRDRREGIRVSGIALNMIIVPVCVEQVTDRLVRPLANLCNVFACAGRQVA
jgi:hypothetical protein